MQIEIRFIFDIRIDGFFKISIYTNQIHACPPRRVGRDNGTSIATTLTHLFLFMHARLSSLSFYNGCLCEI